MLNPETGAGLLHRLTSYTPTRAWDVPIDDHRVRHDQPQNDPATAPPPMKVFSGQARHMLPRDLPEPGVEASIALAGHRCPEQPLDAAHLGRLLFLGAGVVRTTEVGGHPLLLRASGSAGARFPLEVYVSTRGVADLPDAVYWYDGLEHALVRVGPAAGGDATTIIITGVPWRTAWRYAERGWRHLYWDAGTLLSQVEAGAASAGFEPRLRTRFPDAVVRDLVGADGVREMPLALLTLGAGRPAIVPAAPAIPGSLPDVEHPLCTMAQRSGECDDLGRPWPMGPALRETPRSLGLDEVILRRGSHRHMVRGAPVARSAFTWAMDVALRGVEVPHWVVAHDIEGIDSGVHRWPSGGTPLLGDLRDEMTRICLGQTPPGDAAFVVVSACDPNTLDDHSYREAQLAAGLVEGRLHLAAYALGLSATGMTFYDSEVPALLGEADDLVTLLFTCVGVPGYRGRAGGKRGEPTAVRL